MDTVPVDKVKVATVGCGFFSRFHHEAWQRLDVDLVGVCDRDPAKARAFSEEFGGAAAYSDAAEMLDRASPQLVDIIVPPSLHLELVRLAARLGIHVICQKPFTQNLEEAREAVAVAEAAGIVLVVHENFRFQPWYRHIRHLLDERALGRIYEIRFDLRPGDGRGDSAYLDRQPYFQRMERFLIRETGIHFVDVFRFLCGEPDSVWGDLRRLNPAITGEDAGMFVLGFSDGVRAVFDGNRLSDHAAENHRLTMGEMRIDAEKGTLRLDGFGRLYLREFGGREESEIRYDWQDHGFGGDCVYRLQKHVVEHFRHGAALENTARSYLRNLAIEQAIYASNSTGRRLPATAPG